MGIINCLYLCKDIQYVRHEFKEHLNIVSVTINQNISHFTHHPVYRSVTNIFHTQKANNVYQPEKSIWISQVVSSCHQKKMTIFLCALNSRSWSLFVVSYKKTKHLFRLLLRTRAMWNTFMKKWSYWLLPNVCWMSEQNNTNYTFSKYLWHTCTALDTVPDRGDIKMIKTKFIIPDKYSQFILGGGVQTKLTVSRWTECWGNTKKGAHDTA